MTVITGLVYAAAQLGRAGVIERNLNNITDATAWDEVVSSLPHAHLLQSWAWGEFKSRHGWQARRMTWPTAAGTGAAQMLTRTAMGVLRVLYVPRGPVVDWAAPEVRATALQTLESLARRDGAILIKIDPEVAVSRGAPGHERPQPVGEALRAELQQRGWRFSPNPVQFRNTVTLDLRPQEAELLAAMKPKTRYNLRLAERKGVKVRPGTEADLDQLYRLYAETAVRDGFVIRPEAYYRDAWGSFMAAGMALPFIAEVEGAAVAALVVFRFARTAVYMYGMSSAAHRDKMPNHLLQWEAMRWARAQGCETYDFWGAPDDLNEQDGMWGVWKFKEGFGGEFVQGIGAWDYAPSPAMYRLYATVLPWLLGVMRRRGKRALRATQD
jgi:lipid II:glycine glycyltransferase (peptidoglycan interpeptide bridge formation enzyme)